MKIFFAIFFLLIFNSSMFAYTQKTFISPRPPFSTLPTTNITNQENYPKNYWKDIIPFTKNRLRDQKRKTRAVVKIVPFYGKSKNKKDIGKYFGVDNKNSVVFGLGDQTSRDVYYRYLIHNVSLDDSGAELRLFPEYKNYGFECFYYLGLERFKKGLFISVDARLARVEHDLNSELLYNFQLSPIKDFFIGEYNNTSADDLQDYLKKAKIKNKQSDGGVSSCMVSTGLNFIDQPSRKLTLATFLEIPTGNRPTGEYLWEPIYGNGHHLGLGLRISGNSIIWKSNKNKIFLDGQVQYKYLFPNHQTRTLGLRGVSYGHYYLLGRKGMQNEPLIPAANIITKEVKVTPGAHLELKTLLSGHYKTFSFKFGYEFAFCQQEEILLEDFLAGEQYGIAAPGYDTEAAFTEDTLAPLSGAKWVQIDAQKAQAEEVIAHRFSLSLEKMFKLGSKYSFGMGLGAAYTIPSRNSAFELWEGFGSLFLLF